MLNWTTGAGTAKYWASKLLIDTVDLDHDRAVLTRTADIDEQHIFCQGFIRMNGQRWALLVNKRNANVDVFLPGATGGTMLAVTEASGFGPPIETQLMLSRITLNPFAVVVVHFPHA